MIVPVADPFQPYAEAAVARLNYLYPAAKVTLTAEGIEASDHAGISLEVIWRDIHHALYREKIYAETLAMRRSLLEAVTRR